MCPKQQIQCPLCNKQFLTNNTFLLHARLDHTETEDENNIEDNQGMKIKTETNDRENTLEMEIEKIPLEETTKLLRFNHDAQELDSNTVNKRKFSERKAVLTEKALTGKDYSLGKNGLVTIIKILKSPVNNIDISPEKEDSKFAKRTSKDSEIVKLHRCSQCPKTYQSFCSLKIHNKIVHEGEKPRYI